MVYAGMNRKNIDRKKMAICMWHVIAILRYTYKTV